MIKYKKYQNTNSTNEGSYQKWYARPVSELVEFDEFIKHMVNHHCVFSEATIRGVIIEMETCLRELLLAGKAVRIDDLGIFRIGIHCQGAETAKELTANNIKSVSLNLFLGKRFRSADLFNEVQFREADKYAGFDEVDNAEAAGTHSADGELAVTE